MSLQFTFKAVAADQQERSSFLEFVRLRGEYLYDALFVTKFGHAVEGVQVDFEYERNGTRVRSLSTVLSHQDWAASRQLGEVGATPAEKRDALANTPMVLRLFAEGARHYNEANKASEVSFAADAAFLADIGPTP